MIPHMIKVVLSFMVWSSFIYLSGISNEFSETVFGLDEFPLTEDPFALFQRWSEKYEKVYETQVEMEKRFQIFETNLNYIAEHNAEMPLASYRLGPTRFADVTPEEFSKIYLNTIPPNSSQVEQQNYSTNVYRYSYVNYTAMGVVTPVKDQGQCESSGAFATTAAFESAYLLAGKGTADFSEQQIIDCTYSKDVCNGGSVEEAFKWVTSNGGIASEASYPYTARKGNCETKEKAITIDGYRPVSPESEDHLAYMLNMNGPFVVVVHASASSFMAYSGGIYDDYDCSDSNVNHAVLLTGVLRGSSGGESWIIKNSWGKYWGERGFMRMAKGINVCSIINSPVYIPTIHKYT